MKNNMGFQTIEVLSFFSIHMKQIITILKFEIKIFSHCFVAFKEQKDIVDH
jgi:hypothetical protein